MRVVAALLLLATLALAEDDRRIAPLMALMEANDEQLRLEAAYELAEIGASAAPAVARLLDDPWPDFRENACFCLGEMKAGALAFAPRLAAVARKDKFEDVRKSALEALVQVDAETALTVLLDALKDPIEGVRLTARWAMEDLPASVLEDLLEHPDAAVREAAIDARKKDPSDVARLARVLARGDKDSRVAAAKRLAEWREEARPGLDAILSACADDDGEVAEAAIHALGQVDPGDARAHDVALRALSRPEAEVREEGLCLLWAMGERARPVASAVIRALSDRDPTVRSRAAMTLGEWRVAEAAGGLKNALADTDDDVRVAAAEGLWKVTGEIQPALGTLRGVLRSEDRFARQRAVWAIAEMGMGAEAALPDLLVVAEAAGKDSWDQRACAGAIAAVGNPEAAWKILLAAHAGEGEDDDCECGRLPVHLPPAFLAAKLTAERPGADLAVEILAGMTSDAVPAVAPLLAHDRAEVRRRAVGILARRTEDTPEVVPVLVRALGDADAEVRWSAAEALDDVAPTDAIRKGLSEALDREPDPGTRVALASALAKAGGERDKIVPALLSALGDPDVSWEAGDAIQVLLEKDPGAVAVLEPRLSEPGIRLPLAKALVRAAPKSAVPILREAIARGTVVTLWDWHDLGAEALPLLREALSSGSAEVRRSAVEQLGSYATFPTIAARGVDAEAAARELAPLVGDASPGVRASVLEVLGELGPLAAPAVPGLIRLLDGPDRLEAARVLMKIGRPAKAAAPKLADLLRKDPDREVRIAAALALGGLGKEAGEHSHALHEAAQSDPDERVRYCAALEGMRSSIETGSYAIGVGGGRR